MSEGTIYEVPESEEDTIFQEDYTPLPSNENNLLIQSNYKIETSEIRFQEA